MKTNININSIVYEKLHGAFSQFPVSIQESPEGPNTLWVCVFAVPADQVRSVKNFIHGIQSELLAESDVLLLPMVKNLETTQQHYPKYIQSEPAVPVAKMIEQYLLDPVRQMSAWQPAKRGAICDTDYRTAIARLDFTMGKITGGKWTTTPIYEKEVQSNTERALAANTELALAA